MILYESLSKAGLDKVLQVLQVLQVLRVLRVLRVWLRYPGTKYFGDVRTPPTR